MKALGDLKKHKAFLLILLICLIFSTAFAQKESKELLVFAGSGMRLPLNEIGERFETLYGIKVIYDYGGSGRLGNKILVGQSPDVFIPGSDKWAKILKKKDYIEGYSPIAYHTPVIITPKGNGKVNSLGDFLNSNNRLVLGDDRAAAIGDASAAIFKKAGLEESRMNVRAKGQAVKQLVLWIEGNNADASIVWKADAVQSGRVRIVGIPEQYNVRSIIPVCQMVKHKEETNEYINYLLGVEGKAIFKKHGFEVVE
ncbi:MAG: molybdate ABC transporter substrate-binding protein [Desulfobacteraceae bacterium]|nr:molybdate ABC transporter substrate-binding protein [Desulfobacteraceae bacterium]MBC2720342.1 molybdate ABC transporter substrate-binding protein [Desulfobacteraceae bacterium]